MFTITQNNKKYILNERGSILEDGTSNGCFYICASYLLREKIGVDIPAATLKYNIVKQMGMSHMESIDRQADRDDILALIRLYDITAEVYSVESYIVDNEVYYEILNDRVQTFGNGVILRFALIDGHYYTIDRIETVKFNQPKNTQQFQQKQNTQQFQSNPKPNIQQTYEKKSSTFTYYNGIPDDVMSLLNKLNM